MAKLFPFKAIRPKRDLAHLVAARPYASYKKKVLRAKLKDNPFTFLHIINPESTLKIDHIKSNEERFNLVRQRYMEFLEDDILHQDDSPTFYIYRQTTDSHVFTGLICGASIDEYQNDKIKKHEATLTSREEMFTNYLEIVGYNAEPVLLSYERNEIIQELLNEYTLARPENEFSTTDRIKHELWVLSENQTAELTKAFEDIDNLYIADGHHRSASSAGLFERSGGKFPNQNGFLSFIIDEQQLNILEFNRAITTLNGHSPKDFLSQLSKHYTIQEIEKRKRPKGEHQITMCLQGTWYKLILKDESIPADDPVKTLDAQILTDTILTPVLGIEDLKTDKRIECISGKKSLKSIEKSIHSGAFEVAFILYPTTIEQVKRVADNHLIMPPKSTYIEPKMRSGLTIYKINE